MNFQPVAAPDTVLRVAKAFRGKLSLKEGEGWQ